MATETTVDVISLNLNLGQYNKPSLEPILLNKSYEADSSSSTTSTNSPVISSHQLEPLCPCNDFIAPRLDCTKCAVIQQEYNTIKAQLDYLKEKKAVLNTQQNQLETQISDLGDSLRDKLKSIETTAENITSLQYDLQVLESKCKEETSQVEDIQQSKENVKKELEELSIRLFEEADKMIQAEKAEQEILKKRNGQLETDLKSAQLVLVDAESQLKLIRNELPSPEGTEQEAVDTYTRAQIEMSLMHSLDLGIFMDTLENDGALMEFNDFVQTLYKTPLRKLNSLKYMKYCIREDIEPCLRFGPNPKLSSKKIIDAILVKTCFVEECPEGFVTEQAMRLLKEEATATLWERFVTSSAFLGCQACGRQVKEEARPNVLKYRFRISYFDEWACIDRYCRDRLLSAIEFYLFIRHLRAGVYKHRSLHELYEQLIRLKLQMFLARMGTLPDMLQNCGIDPERMATAFHGEEINNHLLLLAEASITSERLSSSTESSITISTVESTRTSASFF
ncbi:uncharacterized protein B0P05DRAFT_540458 [Gilbertella persicaria]|uniref:uncharacterized protein n=1 Tax=Gilbertella persicaria TaxID=101096 RepID=UPI0022202A0D|nr:uncharacterized protein B0P05DRAFT_540458 [Gilbertella persicaria]KAI8080219.1 hypothetical protein B0P05DRAFT_540458 [Gilbertella persicaria]